MIRLHLGSVTDLLDGPGLGAALVHADPPWRYYLSAQGAAGTHYDGLPEPEIADHVRRAAAHATPDAYMLLWCTWPKLAEWMTQDVAPWRYITGGSWHKTNGLGVGYHVRGDSEPWLLYGVGKPKPVGTLSNALASPRQEHSAKPAEWLGVAFRALMPPGSTVFDLYAGLGTAAVGAQAAGMAYVGAEIDPERHGAALDRLRQGRMFC